MEKKSFILSIIALAVSIVTLAVVFIRVTPNSVIDLGTFIGVMTALIGISITFLVGYQIYNAIEIRQKLAEVDQLQEKLKQLEQFNKSAEEGFYIIQARMAAGKAFQQPNALFKMLNAILVALDVDHKADGYQWMLDELKEYMLLFHLGCFWGTLTQKKEEIERIKSVYLEIDQRIRKHPNYDKIRSKYEELMEQFEARLNLIAEGHNVSQTELDKQA